MATDKKYDRRKEWNRRDQAEQSESGRDIAPLRFPLNVERKAAARYDFRQFCESYYPNTFTMGWSEDHLAVIAAIQEAALNGGQFANAMPRGSGKTTLCECGCAWAVLYGHHPFVCLIGSDEASAEQSLASIKTDFECNELLQEDFPEAVQPVEELEGISNRAKGQLHNGYNTRIGWKAKEIVMPMIFPQWESRPDLHQFLRPSGLSLASGAIFRVAGITGRVRGMKFKRSDGGNQRPSFAVVDDPQTDESARSPTQVEARKKITLGAILGLPGPGKKAAVVMPCTVIARGDLADQLLNRQKHPEWNGQRTEMVKAWPTNTRLWEEYREIRADGMRSGQGVEAANEFYRNHFDAMNEGARVYWDERKKPDELTAIQHAMNLKYDLGDAAFFAEYQNAPLSEEVGVDDLDAEELAKRCLGIDRGIAPQWATRLTCFIDIQQRLLYWMVCAWGEDFSGVVVDYGTYPEQPRGYFTAQDARRTLAMELPGSGLEGSIAAGLEKSTLALLAKEWHREDGADMKIERCLIDANWQDDTVFEFCRRSPFSGVVMPRRGRGDTAGNQSFDNFKQLPGDRYGFKWRIRKAASRTIPNVLVEVNSWKSFVAARLLTPMGDKGALSFFGKKAPPEDHKMLIDHLTAETRVRTEGMGRTLDEWKSRPDRRENHWWDCLVGCAVAANVQGTQFEAVSSVKKPRQKVSLAERQRAAFARQGLRAG